MKYIYRNLKHVMINGIPPGETKEFDHELLGGGIELVNQVSEEKEVKKRVPRKREEADKE